jgi:chromosome segregation ATPase
MAWGSKELEQENMHLKAQLDNLKERVTELQEDKVDLRAQLGRLQEALIAKEAPQAYVDQKIAEEQADIVPPTPEEQEYQKELAATNRRLLESMESPLFPDVESFHDSLASTVLRDHLKEVFPGTSHGDDES